MKVKEENKCLAKRKHDGAPCQYPKVEGRNRCRFHGGNTKRGIESGTFKHGNRSKYANEQVLEKIQKFRDADDVRDLRDELSILRGILHSYLATIDNILEDDKIDTVTKLCDKIEKIVSSLKVIEEGHTFTIKNVNNVILQLVKIIQLRVTDSKVRTIIAQDIRKLSYISVS